ncbi:MAG: hypothetical protein Rubg2KO_38580 [Rubricoccaceae bacterium]
MRVLLFAVLFIFAACDSTSPNEITVEGITFRVDRTHIQRGNAVELALVNESRHVLSSGVLGCAVVERTVGDDWVVQTADNQHACPLPIIVVEPGQTSREAFTLDVPPGTVRLVHSFGLDGISHEIQSPAIRVTD